MISINWEKALQAGAVAYHLSPEFHGVFIIEEIYLVGMS